MNRPAPSQRTFAIRRISAFGIDGLVIVLWGGLLFGGVMLLSDGQPARPPHAWAAQALGLVTMTVPVALGFALAEASGWRATPGKRLLGLTVTSESGGRLRFRAALARNALKFLPWEMGHTIAQQAIYAGEGGVPAWAWAPAILSLALPAWWIVALISSGRAPYDAWSATRVVHAPAHARL